MGLTTATKTGEANIVSVRLVANTNLYITDLRLKRNGQCEFTKCKEKGCDVGCKVEIGTRVPFSDFHEQIGAILLFAQKHYVEGGQVQKKVFYGFGESGES